MSIFRVTLTASLLDQRIQNVLHFQDAPLTDNTEAMVRQEMIDGWLPILRNVQNANFKTVAIKVHNIWPVLKVPVETTVSNQQGSLAGDPAPPFVAALFSIRTNHPGRAGRGRFYMCGVHKESMANGKNAAMSSYIPRANDLILKYCDNGTAGIRLCVASRTNPNGAHVATNIIVREIWGIQRRRNIGVGA